mmetsp:Transcript_53173/g.106641  ORF Transcript_53173/g.106641 Transcript_53173/m.106641 type:complete len:224 (+) Transcript_53173:553-1224(+)
MGLEATNKVGVRSLRVQNQLCRRNCSSIGLPVPASEPLHPVVHTSDQNGTRRAGPVQPRENDGRPQPLKESGDHAGDDRAARPLVLQEGHGRGAAAGRGFGRNREQPQPGGSELPPPHARDGQRPGAAAAAGGGGCRFAARFFGLVEPFQAPAGGLRAGLVNESPGRRRSGGGAPPSVPGGQPASSSVRRRGARDPAHGANPAALRALPRQLVLSSLHGLPGV